MRMVNLVVVSAILFTSCNGFVLTKNCKKVSQVPQQVVKLTRTIYIRLLTSVSPNLNWDSNDAPKLNFDEDFYSVLEVDTSVDAKDLKKAYYKLVFQYHPDNIENEASKELCNKQMMVINGAYRILKNPITRTLYDRQRKRGLFGSKSGIKETSTLVPGDNSSTAPSQKAKEKTPNTSSTSQSSQNNDGSFYYDEDIMSRKATRPPNQNTDKNAEQWNYEPQPQPQRQTARKEGASAGGGGDGGAFNFNYEDGRGWGFDTTSKR